MLVDFHCHTTASDGSLTPDQLLSRAIANGVDLLSITDHDTLAAYTTLSRPNELKLIPGIEISCHWQKRGLHIVGLNVDPDSAAIADAIERQTFARKRRAEIIAEKLEKYGVEEPLAGARAIAGEATLGRPHFARYLEQTGFVKNVHEAFKKYLGSGKPCDIKVCWPSPEVAIDWIRDAGGVSVLAHPGKYKFTRSWLIRCMTDFSDQGGQAMEVVSGRQLPAETRLFSQLADNFGLHCSLGSDFHSPDQHWLDLGRYSSSPPLQKPVWDLW